MVNRRILQRLLLVHLPKGCALSDGVEGCARRSLGLVLRRWADVDGGGWDGERGGRRVEGWEGGGWRRNASSCVVERNMERHALDAWRTVVGGEVRLCVLGLVLGCR